MTARALGLRLAAMALFTTLAGCNRPASDRVQGYAEGEYVYVASPFAGQVETLSVKRGDWVKPGDPLFALECGLETAAHDEAQRRVAQAHANLEDAMEGQRPTELEAIQAQLDQARIALILSRKEAQRQDKLEKTGATSQDEVDRAHSTLDQDGKRITQMEATLQTAQLGSRTKQIAAAAAVLQSQEAALAQADWNLSQKRQSSPSTGLVYDLMYQQGEWVAAGKPIVALLPPENIKVRAFVSEEKVGAIQPGGRVSVFVDGVGEPYVGKVSYISPQAEYTPPVIYSQSSRKKLVFMVEARFDAATAAKLHPGQPVDVEFR
jgi:HlyD family secretion protein